MKIFEYLGYGIVAFICSWVSLRTRFKGNGYTKEEVLKFSWHSAIAAIIIFGLADILGYKR